MNLSLVRKWGRRRKRLKVDERALVWCHQNADAPAYQLIDIDEGGLSFKYLGEPHDPATIQQVSLFYGQRLMVEKLPVEIVSDILLEKKLVPVRRAGVRFLTLDGAQSQALVYFIEHCTKSGQHSSMP